jgi:hypothetical protein
MPLACNALARFRVGQILARHRARARAKKAEVRRVAEERRVADLRAQADQAVALAKLQQRLAAEEEQQQQQQEEA